MSSSQFLRVAVIFPHFCWWNRNSWQILTKSVRVLSVTVTHISTIQQTGSAAPMCSKCILPDGMSWWISTERCEGHLLLSHISWTTTDFKTKINNQIHIKLEQLECLRSEDTPRRPMITHTIDQFILNPKSILLTTIDQFISDPKSKQGESRKIRKISEKFKFLNFVINLTRDTSSNWC